MTNLNTKQISLNMIMVRKRNKERKDQINQYLKLNAKNIIGTWFSRDSLGNMDTHEWVDQSTTLHLTKTLMLQTTPRLVELV